jgi:phage gp45-like
MNSEQLRERTSKVWTSIAALARRVALELTGGGMWQISGHEDETDDDVPAFQGIGFASRPASGSTGAEAIVIKVGADSGHPVIVATRDEDARKVHTLVKNLDVDETAIYTRQALIVIDKDGDIIIRSKAGRTVAVDDGSGAVALALQAELADLKTRIAAWVVVPGDGGGALKPIIAAWPVTGTTVLKGK